MDNCSESILLEWNEKNMSSGGPTIYSNEFPQLKWSDVVHNKDGSIRNPLVIDGIVFSVDSFCCLLGLPLNFYMAKLILCDRRLRKKPRNIFLVDMIICNIFTLFTASLEILNFFWSNETVCKIYVSITGLSYVSFYFNLLLSLIDRFVAIKLPFWHRRKVTAKLAIFSLLIINLGLLLAVKWIYVGGIVPLRCEIQISHGLTFQGTLCVELVSCIIFHVINYVQTRGNLPRPSRTIPISSTRQNRVSQRREMTTEEAGGAGADTTVNVINERQTMTLSIHMNSEGINRLENETTKTFLIGVIPILFLSLPWLVFAIFYHICHFFYGDMCSHFTWLIPYFKALMSFHAVVHPLANICRNEELASPPPTQMEHVWHENQFG